MNSICGGQGKGFVISEPRKDRAIKEILFQVDRLSIILKTMDVMDF